MVFDTVDLLTRSVAGFAKPIDLFNQRGVSRALVSQSFDTTSSTYLY